MAKTPRDRNEATDLASVKPDLIRQAKEILQRETSENIVFPLALPD